MAFCDVKSKDTMRRKARKYNMPLFYWDQRPAISTKDLQEWWDEIKRKNGGSMT